MVVSILSIFVVDLDLKIWEKYNNCNNIYILKIIFGEKKFLIYMYMCSLKYLVFYGFF